MENLSNRAKIRSLPKDLRSVANTLLEDKFSPIKELEVICENYMGASKINEQPFNRNRNRLVISDMLARASIYLFSNATSSDGVTIDDWVVDIIKRRILIDDGSECIACKVLYKG